LTFFFSILLQWTPAVSIPECAGISLIFKKILKISFHFKGGCILYSFFYEMAYKMARNGGGRPAGVELLTCGKNPKAGRNVDPDLRGS